MSAAPAHAQGNDMLALKEKDKARLAADDDCVDLQGVVKWFDVKKGFGFIVGPQGQDVFVHFSAIDGDGFRSLRDGEPVTYQLCEGDKGFHAQAVRRDESKQESQSGNAGFGTPVHREIPQPDAAPRRRPAIDGYVG